MGTWFQTPKQKIYVIFLMTMALLFGALTAISHGDGTEIWSKTYLEQEFESESMSDQLIGRFDVGGRKVCMLRVEGLTLNQSWIWVKALVLDEKGRPVHDLHFDLAHYHGNDGDGSWSEGDKEAFEVFILPKGKYSVVVYGEDENPHGVGPKPGTVLPKYETGYTTIDRDEKIKLTLFKDVMLTRYFLALFITFMALLVGYVFVRKRQSRAQVETTANT